MTIDVSMSAPRSGRASGRTRVPSDSCLKILLTAIIPAAPVNAARSAPTYPGVAFARAVKLKSPSSLSFDERTRRILRRYGFRTNMPQKISTY